MSEDAKVDGVIAVILPHHDEVAETKTRDVGFRLLAWRAVNEGKVGDSLPVDERAEPRRAVGIEDRRAAVEIAAAGIAGPGRGETAIRESGHT